MKVLFKNIKLETVFVVLILLFFAFLRLHRLDKYPLQINQDELSNIYDGYCIAETGADRWSDKHPLILHGFGNFDSRPAMYAWMAAGCIKIGGHSIFMGRIPAAILGIISLLLIFLVTDKLLGKKAAFVALISAGLSPWHLLFSRLAHEGAMPTAFFFILSLYLFLIAREKKYPLILTVLLGLSVGLGTNAYQSGRLLFFLFAVLILIDIFKINNKRFKSILVLCAGAIIGAMPQILVLLKYPELFAARAGETVIKPEFKFDYFNYLIKNIWANFSPDYLFFSSGKYSDLSVARLLLVEVLFLYLGFIVFNKLRIKNGYVLPNYVMYILLLFIVLPSVITQNCPHALRASSLMMVFPIFIGAGVVWILNRIKLVNFQKVFYGVVLILIGFTGLGYIWVYKNSYEMRNMGHQNLLTETCIKLNSISIKYEQIYIEHSFVEPYIYVAAYCNITPNEFQKFDVEFNQPNRENVKRLGKYHFLNKEVPYDSVFVLPKNTLLITRNKINRFAVVDSLNLEEGTTFYLENKK